MIIEIKGVSFTYNADSPLARKVLDDTSVSIAKGEFVGIIGRTGSGKSTLVQHMNGLLRPDSGLVMVDGLDIWSKGAKLQDVRKKVGLVFQYPEHQLFDETVLGDVAFGPRNMGLGEEEVIDRVVEAMDIVNLDFEAIKDRSPFELSGGQKRRVAIAGVLAMKPEVVILDEPAAGMDPAGRDEILGEIDKMHTKGGFTVVLVSHSMEDVAKHAERLIVMDAGRAVLSGDPRTVFSEEKRLLEMGLGVPQTVRMYNMLRQRGIELPMIPLTVEQLGEMILDMTKTKGHGREVAAL
ncbi:MAG TPA: energy-coupling factor transporter ATPase [Bacillota bacterium]|nr:energy-coupling factor transporter ATPase [Bacillota bacterium]HOH10977.1 energy-coupling factor transporter ATPase [Bacillota bacterium]HOY89068.1 energy-coupling factor transporter ATPase [Bacillota bacterium]HPI02057.1 energy-coupling factor transporter ATPase [Bacillota bacterium]HPM64145.1 energy-coupling factor transporter ATPase [Bacillota bacterium]